jgi:cysteine desulfuration protein SufE
MSMPDSLARIVRLFADAPKELRVQALLDYSKRLPPLPPELEASGTLERVHECQTPFFVATEVADDGTVTFAFDAPPEAPTTRGYAGILKEGLTGASVAEVLAVPDDFYVEMGLSEVVTPLRLRGMGAILARIKHQICKQVPAQEPGAAGLE